MSISGIKTITVIFGFIMLTNIIKAQNTSAKPQWIRPDNEKSPPIWGIHNGIVVGLWPASIEKGGPGYEGGPRGLLRIGYEYGGTVYLINYIAVEPVVNGDMEFSEVTESRVDGKWGKLFWAADSTDNEGFSPYASTRGRITHPDSKHPEVEELSLYVFMEKFLDGAHPYLKLSIRSDNSGELCLQIFNHDGSAKIERCALTATMGNYSRLRLLYLKDKVVDSRQLFAGYNDIEFAEKEPYPAKEMIRNSKGDYVVYAESNETFNELASWPQQQKYLSAWGWHYRPFYKLTQYWRVDSADYDPSLLVRVNGRAKYWGGDSADKSKYMDVPGGPAFENFELRENYHAGQKFYFGLSMKAAKDLIAN
ncbi:hypothetical protein SAMN05216490_2438 [Mucilaginibacter mallensis]|uniref:Uncharacterized protein n=1 Tax=Mucilaginibacter mallensis TaxID=652787 RepID=A0A1H1XF70_MUCMA|nr:hypothetical protein [Mucilaginibacter mallensis]SDT07935.1 hypothetical protein SAMN05216490_2438 [Mucilaginibacter mallensis]